MCDEAQDITFERTGDITIARLRGKILDPVYIDRLDDQLRKWVESAEQPRIVLDFTEVSHLSSAALGMLTTLQQAVQERGGRLRLCNIQPPLFKVFKITRLNEILDIRENRKEAIESLQ